MRSPQRVAIDPPEVRRGADELRLRADVADDISSDTTRALVRADLPSVVPAALADIDEELRLLADILVRRADMADTSQLALALNPRIEIEALWESLIDDDGENAIIAGDNALIIVRQHADDLDIDGNGLITLTELRSAASDTSRPALSAAATSLLANQSTLDTLTATTESEVFSTGPELAITTSALTNLLAVNDELRGDAALAASALARGETTIEIDGATVDATDIVANAIYNQVFTHDAGSANDFLQLLPNPANGVPGLSIFAFDTAAVQALYDTAMTGVPEDDLLARFSIVSQMPETRDGIRNEYITELYALGSVALDALVNPDQVGDPSLPGHGGTNWPGWGAGASDTVNGAITGETTILEMKPTPTSMQMMADGNQEIATTILGRYFEFIETFQDGEITEERVVDYLNTFDEGEGDLQMAFALQLGAMATDDPAEKQEFQLQSNIAVSVYEQAVIDDELDFNRLEWEAQVGAYLLSTGISIVTGQGVAPLSASELMTQHGTLELEQPDGSVVSFELDKPIPPGPQENNLVSHLEPGDELNAANYELDDIGIPGINQVNVASGISETTELSNDYDDWDHSPTHASDWTKHAERLPHVVDLMHKHHVSPLAFNNVEAILDR